MSPKPSRPAIAIAKFLADELRQNQWLAGGHVGLYVRKSMRPHCRGEMSFHRQCLDVAAWEIRSYRSARQHGRYSHAHLRQLIDFMREIERAVVLQGWDGVFVELVRDPVLQKHLRANAYTRLTNTDDPRPSFYKSRTTIVATSPWVSDLCLGGRALPRPSLSAFAADPSLSTFWIRDQSSGYQILLKREVIDARAITPQLRVTIAEFSRCATKTPDFDSDEAPSPPSPDLARQALTRILARIQRRVQGIAQLAVRLEAIRQDGAGYGCKQWLLDQGYEMERHNRMRESITDRMVKRLE